MPDLQINNQRHLPVSKAKINDNLKKQNNIDNHNYTYRNLELKCRLQSLV